MFEKKNISHDTHDQACKLCYIKTNSVVKKKVNSLESSSQLQISIMNS